MLFNGYVCYGRFYLIMNIMWYLCCYRCIWDIHNKNLKKGKCEMRKKMKKPFAYLLVLFLLMSSVCNRGIFVLADSVDPSQQDSSIVVEETKEKTAESSFTSGQTEETTASNSSPMNCCIYAAFIKSSTSLSQYSASISVSLEFFAAAGIRLEK